MTGENARLGWINTRALAALVMLCAGAWLVLSGIALHLASPEAATGNHLFMSMHNAAALLFMTAAAVHLILNGKALTRHMRTRAVGCLRVKRELLIAVIGVYGFVVLVASHALHLS